MLWTEVQQSWKELQGKFQTKWSKLTTEDLKAIAGKRDELIARLHKLYKTEKPKLEKEVDDFLKTLKKPAKV